MADQTYRNIIIVGASTAGHTLANDLVPILPEGYRILLIDALEYSYFPQASLRAAIVPGWEEKIVLPLKTSTCFPQGTNHRVIAPTRVTQLKKNSVVLEKPFEGSTEVPFFKAVIATGATQPSPMRPSLNWTSQQEYMKALRKSQEEIKKCESLVIIGGGTVGVEFAGEVRASYPDKPITIIHNRSTLLTPLTEPRPSGGLDEKIPESWTSPPINLKLANTVASMAKSQKVNLILNDKAIIPQRKPNDDGIEIRTIDGYEWDGSFGLQPALCNICTENREIVKGDYVFLSIGNKPNSGLIVNSDGNAVEKSTGLIRVDQRLKIKASILSDANYYAIGDVSNAPGMKIAYLALIQAKSAATNIVNEINHTPLAAYNPGMFGGLFVAFGPDMGAGYVTIPYLGTWALGSGIVRTAKGKKLLLDKWGPFRKGEERVNILI
ncbi:hypothetical protein I302_104158 [Kwoniella bestiolae CBS 10118]|uniref:FAD/NAD(P)-binding domain-containing protein n=1 Tax=Kwoniella bestiolae CBS 10118 TaxID=1296100 RepID=A0A1B9GAG8_9TREE|nr:hypothetical protein I302_02865 [Kwoniella bestiolae CBS 10118]OCF28014.1 hypothetical protein I302_02865 [Kwoniella bestiolae CBS 10118]